MKEFLDEYSEFTESIDLYLKVDPNNVLKVFQLLMGIVGIGNEAGELLGKIKKIIRDKNCELSNDDKKIIEKEIGDIVWYIVKCCRALNISLYDIIQMNIEKLFSRAERNVISGSGDNR